MVWVGAAARKKTKITIGKLRTDRYRKQLKMEQVWRSLAAVWERSKLDYLILNAYSQKNRILLINNNNLYREHILKADKA